MRYMLGHDGPPKNYYFENFVSGAPLLECPLRTVLRARESQPALMREVDRYWDEHYPNYKEGFLLNSGGTADQPARYVAFMTVINDVRARQQAKYHKVTTPEPSAPPAMGA